MLLPTVSILTTIFASADNDDEYTKANLREPSNTTVGNTMDCCSISLPFKNADTTIALVITACANLDLNLFDFAVDREACLSG